MEKDVYLKDLNGPVRNYALFADLNAGQAFHIRGSDKTSRYYRCLCLNCCLHTAESDAGLLIVVCQGFFFFFLPSSHPLSFFFSSFSASPGSRTQQHLPPKRAQGGGLVSHHQRPETEDWTPERSQRLNRRSVVYGVSVSN